MYLSALRPVFMLLCITIVQTAMGNDCIGSYGDPIVNITFGAGPNFGTPLSSTTSDLQYTPSACPQDGFYSIINYTSNCASASGNWHTLTDHTGNRDGYFMLVNASFQPSNFYVQSITGLCEKTTYQFAAWLLNMCRFSGILPNLTLTIEKTDGTVLQSYDTGDIPMINPATWKQYGFNFTTPAGVSNVVLRMRNNAPGGGGNDVALDDITFRPVGAAVAIGVTGYTGNTITLCTKNADRLQFTSTVESCYATTAYQWQVSADEGISWRNIPAATTVNYTSAPLDTGTYLYRLVIAPALNIALSTCRTASEPVRIMVLDDPHPDLGAPAELCSKDSLVLNPGNFDTYVWQDGSTQPVFTVRWPGSYAVTVTNACGTGMAAIPVKEISCDIVFPTAFTPDKNGKNDVFKALHVHNAKQYHLSVFNRWGQKVFETTDYEKGWDGFVNGKPAATGLYIWSCDMQHTGAGSTTRVKGIVTLVR